MQEYLKPDCMLHHSYKRGRIFITRPHVLSQLQIRNTVSSTIYIKTTCFVRYNQEGYGRPALKYPDHEDRIFNRLISDIAVVLRETTLTISVPSRQFHWSNRSGFP